MATRGRKLWAGLVVSATSLLVMLFLVPPAGAATTCGFAGSTVTITFGAAGDTATVVRSGTAINVNGTACGAANVNNTDLITFTGVNTGGESVTIDLSGGRFEPGAGGVGEGAGVSEIEIDMDLGAGTDTLTIVGSSATTPALAGDDVILIEDGAANLNDDNDADDLTYLGVDSLIVNSGAGDDTVDASAQTTATPTLNVNGGEGDDWLAGTGGNDTLTGGNGTSDSVDYSAFVAPGVSVNLQGTQTAAGSGGTDTISGFENVYGSSGNDVLTGDQNDNWIGPGDGNDVVTGGTAGNDTLDYFTASGGVTVDLSLAVQNTGGAGTDNTTGFENVYGTDVNDALTGDATDNVLGEGGGGNDTLTGGAGFDIADYFGVTNALTVNLGATPQSITGSGTDTVSGLEGVWGGDGNDTFISSPGDNEFDGWKGTDTIDYSAATAGVTVDLTGEFAEGGGGNDGLFGFENVIGSGFDDSIEGTYGTTAALANNTLNGGAGTDWVSYSQATAGVVVDLGVAIAQNTIGGGTDTLSNFESVAGSAFNDSLTGTAGNNEFLGGAGDDILNGGLGTDGADFSGATAGVTVDLLSGSATGEGTDTLSGIENVTGSAFDDSFSGDAGNNSIDGGDGTDSISYQFAGAAVIVDLSVGLGTGQGTDLLSGIENVKGSTLNDTIIGDGGANKLQGNQGDDSVSGKGGADTLGGSGGDDELAGGGGNDGLKGGSGADFLTGGKGKDSCAGGPGKDTIKSCEK